MIAPMICPHCGVHLSTPREPSRSRADVESPTEPGPSSPAAVQGRPEEPLPEPMAGPPHPVATPFVSAGSAEVAFPIGGDDRGSDEIGPDPKLLGLVLDQAPPGAGRGRPSASPAPLDRAEPPDRDDHDDPDDRRSAWPLALLAGYASAMTLACGWLWWTGHRPRAFGNGPAWAAGLAASEAGGAPGPADPGLRAGASAAVPALEPIAAARRVPIGERLRVDALEVTPLGISRGPVTLVRTRVDGRPERRDGGRGALGLRLLLRNASDDVIFAPLDEAFVREPDRRLPETFIQDGSGARVYAYRLPTSSEWEIAGQEFRELRPGESFETIVVSDDQATERLVGPLTWRLRLRTAPETTAVVGVSFRAAEIDRIVSPPMPRPARGPGPIVDP